MRWLHTIDKDIDDKTHISIDFMQVDKGNICILTCVSYNKTTHLVMIDGVLTNDNKYT